MECNYLLAHVQSKANPQLIKAVLVAPEDVLSFVEGQEPENVVVFQKVEVYETGK